MDVVYDAIVGAATLRQVRRTQYSPSAENLAGRFSGGVDPQAQFLKGAGPRATFECEDLTGVIAGLSITAGLAIASGTITLPWNKRANGGTFVGGSANAILSGTNGLAVIKGISASQGDDGAAAEIELVFLSSDGLTAPVTASVNNALGSQQFNTHYAMGPMYIDSSQLTQVQSIRCDPGIRVETKAFDGSVYPTLAYITMHNPSITVTFENFDALSSQAAIFAAMTTAAAYFRKRTIGGTFAADAGANHVKISMGTGLKLLESAEASQNANGTASLKLMGLAMSASSASTVP